MHWHNCKIDLFEFLNILQIWINRQSLPLPGDYSFANWSTACLCPPNNLTKAMYRDFVNSCCFRQSCNMELCSWKDSILQPKPMIGQRYLHPLMYNTAKGPQTIKDKNPHCILLELFLFRAWRSLENLGWTFWEANFGHVGFLTRFCESCSTERWLLINLACNLRNMEKLLLSLPNNSSPWKRLLKAHTIS